MLILALGINQRDHIGRKKPRTIGQTKAEPTFPRLLGPTFSQNWLQHFNQLIQGCGIALLTSKIGASKSTAIRAFIEQLEPNRFDIAYIAFPTIGIRGILNSIAIQLH